jgi:hypothetical protein
MSIKIKFNSDRSQLVNTIWSSTMHCKMIVQSPVSLTISFISYSRSLFLSQVIFLLTLYKKQPAFNQEIAADDQMSLQEPLKSQEAR